VSTILHLGTRWKLSASRPSRFVPWEIASRYQLDRRLGGVKSRSGNYREENKPCPSANQTRTVQPVTLLHTNWVILQQQIILYNNNGTCMDVSRRGFGLDIGFIDYLCIVTASNYNSPTALHCTALHCKYKCNYSTHKVFSVFSSRLLESYLTQWRFFRVCAKSSLHRLPCNSLSVPNWLTPRLAAITHQPPSLLFTAWLSTEHSCNLLVAPDRPGYNILAWTA
jgi:hypothetical protein